MATMMPAIAATHFQFPNQTAFYKGKVRDVYTLQDHLVMVASDRISAFDHVLPRAIPFKGQVLNQTAAYFLRATAAIVPNWLIDTPDPNVSIGLLCEPFRVEMVIRGYLTGHAWRTYAAGKRELCGVRLPEGMKENDAFPTPIITPTTKEIEGHDEDISKEVIIFKNFVSEKDYAVLEDYTRILFQKGTEMAEERGLILVDTKYEFGKYQGQIRVIDEIHTPDSSRYFYKKGYAQRQAKGEKQVQLSKEFVREWLMAHGFQGKNGQKIPKMTDEWVQEISKKYIHLYETVTGQPFRPAPQTERLQQMEKAILNYFKNGI